MGPPYRVLPPLERAKPRGPLTSFAAGWIVGHQCS